MKQYIIIGLASGLIACSWNEKLSQPSRNKILTSKGANSSTLIGSTTHAGIPTGVSIRGGAVEGAATYYLEQKTPAHQANYFRQEGIHLIPYGDQLRIILPTDSFFLPATSELLLRYQATIEQLALFVKNFQPNRIEISGYTDDALSLREQKQLSQLRAEHIAGLLWVYGVPEEKIAVVKGRGAQQPIAGNLTPQGKLANRRIEIILEKLLV